MAREVGSREADAVDIHFPDSISEAVQVHARLPHALLYAGGTYILSQRPGRFLSLPSHVISLQDIGELRRINRTERYIEIGSGIPLREIARLGEPNLPHVLYQAIRHVGPPTVGGLATIGGNIAIPGRIMTLVPTLAILDAKAELRRPRGSRWIAVSRVHHADGTLELQPGEIITRIRIPLENWNVQAFRRFGTEMVPTSSPLTFCGIARVTNGIVEEIRVIGSAGGRLMFRNTQIEAELVGRRVPIGGRDVVQLYTDSIGGGGEDPAGGLAGISSLQRDRLIQLIRWFMMNLHAL